MTSAMLARIVKLEGRRRPVARILSKEERDARVREVLSDPAQVIEFLADSLGVSEVGNSHFGLVKVSNGGAAIMAALRADT